MTNRSIVRLSLLVRLGITVSTIAILTPIVLADDIVISGTQEFSGTVNNDGTISFDSGGGTFRLTDDVTLIGGGDVVLSGSNTSIIVGSYPSENNLVNQDNVIRGFGGHSNERIRHCDEQSHNPRRRRTASAK